MLHVYHTWYYMKKKTKTATLSRHKCSIISSQNTLEIFREFQKKDRTLLLTYVKYETIKRRVKYCSV